MNATEAIELLNMLYKVNDLDDSAIKLSALIAQQQQQIEQQAAEIAKKDRMLKFACDDKTETPCTNCGAKDYCGDVGDGIDCNIVFYEWLEKEAQGVE